MTDLAPAFALGGDAPAARVIGAIEIREDPGAALAALARRRDGPLPRPFELDLPGPGGWAADGGVGAAWMAPDSWLIVADARAPEDFAAEVKGAAPEASVTELTDAFCALRLTVSGGGGDLLERLLEKLVNLPPDARAPGRATRTVLHHSDVIVIRPEAAALTLLAPAPQAGDVWHAVTVAAERLSAPG